MNIFEAIGQTFKKPFVRAKVNRAIARMDKVASKRIMDVRKHNANPSLPDIIEDLAPKTAGIAVPKLLANNRRLIIFNGLFENTWNMMDMYHAYTAEGFLKYTVDSYIDSAMRNGYHIHSKNDVVIKYLSKRFKEFEIMSGISNAELYRAMFFSLLLYGNVFLAKYRAEDQSSGKTHETFTGKEVKPIAAIYPEDPRRIIVTRENKSKAFLYVRMPFFNRALRSGNIFNMGNKFYENDFPAGSSTYSQMVSLRRGYSSDLEEKEVRIKENDMIHIRYHASIGEKWAMPPFYPALQDIEALRLIEENVELLIYQYGHPIYHAMIGDDKRKGTQEEINALTAKMQKMESNGFLVTDQRTLIKVLGAEGSAIKGEAYLNYFKQRVFTQLWLSNVMTGDGSVARASADIIDKIKQDKTIELQSIIANEIQKLLIEMLQEAGAPLDWILDEENIPSIRFYEVDLDQKIKLENHVMNQFTQGVVTRTECRRELGLDAIPEGDEDDTFPMIQARAKDAEAQAKMQASANYSKSVIQPSNQFVKKSGPGRAVNT